MARVFPCEFYEITITPFLQSTCEWLWKNCVKQTAWGKKTCQLCIKVLIPLRDSTEHLIPAKTIKQ